MVMCTHCLQDCETAELRDPASDVDVREASGLYKVYDCNGLRQVPLCDEHADDLLETAVSTGYHYTEGAIALPGVLH